MKSLGPVLTLLAVVALGVTLFFVNSGADPANQPAAAVSPAPAATAPPATTAAPDPAAAAPAVAEKAYAGRTSGNELTIAIAVKDGRAVAYLCDGKKVEAWLEGTLSGADLSLKNASGSATVTGTADDGKSVGTVTVGEKSWPFAAKAVQAPNGLYEGRADVRGVATRVGWIVLPDGSQTGILKPANGEPEPAPALDPARPGSVTIDGAPVTVKAIGGGDEVTG